MQNFENVLSKAQNSLKNIRVSLITMRLRINFENWKTLLDNNFWKDKALVKKLLKKKTFENILHSFQKPQKKSII